MALSLAVKQLETNDVAAATALVLEAWRQTPDPRLAEVLDGLAARRSRARSSSSDKTKRRSITKTGNRHTRQACWQYRHRAGVGSKLAERRWGQPPRVDIADAAQRRLCSRYARLSERGKPKNKVVISFDTDER